MITQSIRNRTSVAAVFFAASKSRSIQESKLSVLRATSYLQNQQPYKQVKNISTSSRMAQATQTGKPEIAPNTADWESEWAHGIEKGMRWDIGKCEPELVYELSLKDSGAFASLFKRMSSGETIRGLVPGCGRGYAVAAMGEAGLKALGLDLSPTATAIAAKESGRENAKFAVGDFFDSSADHGQFDLIFDSTFLCAISPTMWRQWAKRMSELVAPKGYLAVHLFPVLPGAPDRDPDHPGDEPGPPNRLTVKLVRDLLHGYSFEETLFRRIPAERMARSLLKEQPVEEYWMIYQKK